MVHGFYGFQMPFGRGTCAEPGAGEPRPARPPCPTGRRWRSAPSSGGAAASEGPGPPAARHPRPAVERAVRADGAALLGHLDIRTTRGYVAVFDEDVISHYQQFLASRRSERPQTEYRDPTTQEWSDFQDHFDKRRVELGSCGCPYGTPAPTNTPASAARC
ncbi:hypothetical protein ACU686_42975 [Yinghuangia aomiensis]